MLIKDHVYINIGSFCWEEKKVTNRILHFIKLTKYFILDLLKILKCNLEK